MICMSGLYRPRVRKGARVMDGLCIIYGAGEYFGNEFALPGRDDFVIAADGGFLTELIQTFCDFSPRIK